MFSNDGYINNTVIYSYTPYGAVTAEGSVSQPIQWSSEFYDEEPGLVYYNYRHYNPKEARWIGRDIVSETIYLHRYSYAKNTPYLLIDSRGAIPPALLGLLAAAAVGILTDIGLQELMNVARGDYIDDIDWESAAIAGVVSACTAGCAGAKGGMNIITMMPTLIRKMLHSLRLNTGIPYWKKSKGIIAKAEESADEALDEYGRYLYMWVSVGINSASKKAWDEAQSTALAIYVYPHVKPWLQQNVQNITSRVKATYNEAERAARETVEKAYKVTTDTYKDVKKS